MWQQRTRWKRWYRLRQNNKRLRFGQSRKWQSMEVGKGKKRKEEGVKWSMDY